MPHGIDASFFVGREEQLKVFDWKISKINNSKLIYVIHGEGGVGKTKLLDKMLTDAKSNGFFTLSYDFDEGFVHRVEDIRRRMAYDLKYEKEFAEYISGYKFLDRLRQSNSNVSKQHLSNEHKRLTELWLNCWHDTYKINKKKVLISFDTLDSLSKRQVEQFYKYFLIFLPDNVAILLSGRDEKGHISYLKKLLNAADSNEKRINYENCLLKSFNKLEFEDFYNVKLRDSLKGRSSKKFTPKQAKNAISLIFDTTTGLPILLDLSIDIFLSQKPISDNLINSLNRKHDLEKTREIIINHYLASCIDNMKDLTLVLAHVNPVDEVFIKKVLSLDEEDLVDLLKAANDSSYIKVISQDGFSLYKLHDVMKDMIDKHGWVTDDYHGIFRHNLSGYYVNWATDILDSEKPLLGYKYYEDDLRIQIFQHKVYVEGAEGLEYFNNSNLEKMDSFFIDQCFQVLDKVVSERLVKGKALPEVLKDNGLVDVYTNYLINKTNFLVSRGFSRKNEFESIAEELYEIFDNSSTKELQLHPDTISTARKAILNAFINSAQFSRSIEFIKNQLCGLSLSDRDTFDILKTQGWLYRVIGKIAEADKTYEIAHEIWRRVDTASDNEVIAKSSLAQLFQTWSYTKALLRDQEMAEYMIEDAEELYLQSKNSTNDDLGCVESVYGRIRIEFNNSRSAHTHFLKARELFDANNDVWHGKAILGLCHSLYLRESLSNNSEFDWEPVNSYLDEAEGILSEMDRPEFLFMKAMALYKQEDFLSTANLLDECIATSKSHKNYYFVPRAYTSKIRLQIWRYIKNNEPLEEQFLSDIENEINSLPADFKVDQVSKAIFLRTKGDWAFLNSRFDEALEVYKNTLPLIANNSRFYPDNLKGQLKRMQKIFIEYSKNKNASTAVNKDPVTGYDIERAKNVYLLAEKLGCYWEENESLRKHKPLFDIIRSWYSKDISTLDSYSANHKK